MSEPSPWTPLRTTLFRRLWIASVASNVGSWMHDTGAGWMMTSLSPDPLMVALMQSAASLPLFLFALPSGVLADILDRRRYLIFSQCWVMAAATALGVLTLGGAVTPPVLLLLTFLIGIGNAMAAPPLQAIVPALVTPPDLPAAIALNSLGINISRAIGPALAGLALSLLDPAFVFFINALSVSGILFVLLAWHPPTLPRRLPPESFLPAVRAGLRYVRSAPLLRNVLIRAAGFFMFGSASWSLLPLVARRLGLEAAGYGLLLACLGSGAVAGALLLPRIRKAMTVDALATAATIVFALMTAVMALSRHRLLLGAVMMLAGGAWIAMLSLLNMGAQRSTAGWVKARAMAVYLMTFFGAMAGGSLLWGQLAASAGIPATLLVAAGGMLLSCALGWRWRLGDWPALDLQPKPLALAELVLVPESDQGPMMIDIAYRVAPADTDAFRAAIMEMRAVRKRGGALSWGLYVDMAAPECYHEVWTTASWLDHEREHERFSTSDGALRERVLALHRGPAPPVVTHLIAPVDKAG